MTPRPPDTRTGDAVPPSRFREQVADDPPEPPPLPPWTAHWRGQVPLARAFWLHVVLPLVCGSVLLDALAAMVLAQGRWLQAGSVLLLIGWPLFATGLLWAAVGAWRAAARRVRMSGSLPWHRLAQAALLGLLLLLAAGVAGPLGPRLPELLRLAGGGDRLAPAALQLSADGRRLRVDGALAQGDAARVLQQLQRAPGVKLIELQGIGGRLGEAEVVAQALRRQGAQTRAVGRCEGACVRLWLAGRARHVAPDARLGLHREPVPSANPLLVGWALSWQHAGWIEAGLPETFALHASSSPPATSWRPEAADLVAAGLTGVAERPLDIALPDADGAQPADYADALAGNPVWLVVERRRPGTVADAAQRMQAAHAAPADPGAAAATAAPSSAAPAGAAAPSTADDEAVQLAGQRAMQQAVTDLLDGAGPEMRHQFLLWQADALAHVASRAASGDAARCRALLAGDAQALRTLPPALVRRLADWLLDAATEPDTGTSQPRRSRLEIEVMRRSLGERAPALLLGLQREAQAQGRGPDCELARALIGEVLQLPSAERRLALRLIYER